MARSYKTNLRGNSDTAAKIQTARTISLSGAVTGSASFDGSQDISIATNVAANGTDQMRLIEQYVTPDNSTTGYTFNVNPNSPDFKPTFYDLFVTIWARGSATGTGINAYLQFNNDTTDNYFWNWHSLRNPTTTTGQYDGGYALQGSGNTANGIFLGSFTGVAGASNVWSLVEGYIPNYRGTAFNKSAFGFSAMRQSDTGSAGLFRRDTWGQWNGTAAISSVRVFAGGALATGSIIRLYGRGF